MDEGYVDGDDDGDGGDDDGGDRVEDIKKKKNNNNTEDDVRTTARPLWRCLNSKEAFQHIRCVPLNAGSAVCFTHRVIHWGSKGRKECTRSPRVALSFAASDDSFEPAYLTRDVLPFPPFRLRLALCCAQMIVYADRFGFTSQQLQRFYRIFRASSDEFHATYRNKVIQEYVAASERCGHAQKRGHRDEDDDKDAHKKVKTSDMDEEEEDALDDALDAMLDAQLAGTGDCFRDDFDDDFVDDGDGASS